MGVCVRTSGQQRGGAHDVRPAGQPLPEGRLADARGDAVYEQPWLDTEYGGDRRSFRIVFDTPVSGRMRCSVRMDRPE